MSHFNLTDTTLGRFEIISELGRGGMALVYLARQTDLDRLVALKLLRPELSYDADTVSRFHNEARSAARLDHPHIVPIYDIGELTLPTGLRLNYIAMKYIRGGSLKDLLQLTGHLSLDRTLDLINQVGGALDYAHQRGVIHRDVKPGNILLSEDEVVYLGDFGLACGISSTTRLTQHGMVLGTPEYMAPEQVQGQTNLGPATDIYALGVVIYELLTGTFPFEVDTPTAMMVARLMQEPRSLGALRSDIPPAVELVISKALSRDPADRFTSVSAMLWALRHALVPHNPGIPPSPALQRRDDPTHRRDEATTGQTIALPQPAPPTATTGPTLNLPQLTAGETPHPAPKHRAPSRKRHQAPPEHQEVSQQHQPRQQTTRSLLASWPAALLLIVTLFGMGAWLFTPDPPPTGTVTPTLSDSTADLLQAGWQALDADMYPEALQAFAMAATLDDTNPETFYGQGRVLMEQQSYDQALTAFRQALQLDPKNAIYHAWFGQANLERGQASEQASNTHAAEQDYAQAEKSFTLAASLDNQNAFIQTGLGWAYYNQTQFAAARAAFEAALVLDDLQGDAHNGLGWTLYELQEYPAAREHFMHATRLNPTANDFYGLGKALQALGRTAEARAAYLSALDIDPNYPDVADDLERLNMQN